jgi:hypothetical protein
MSHDLNEPIIISNPPTIRPLADRKKAIFDAINNQNLRKEATTIAHFNVTLNGIQYTWMPTMIDFTLCLFDVSNYRTLIACEEFGISDPESKWDSDNVEDQLIAMKVLRECEFSNEYDRVIYDNLFSDKKVTGHIFVDGMGIVREGNKRLFCLWEMHRRGIWTDTKIPVIIIYKAMPDGSGGYVYEPICDAATIKSLKEHFNKYDDGKRDHDIFEKSYQTYRKYGGKNPCDHVLPEEIASKTKEDVIKKEYLRGEVLQKFRERTKDLKWPAGHKDAGSLRIPVRTGGTLYQTFENIIQMIGSVRRIHGDNLYVKHAYDLLIEAVVRFYDECDGKKRDEIQAISTDIHELLEKLSGYANVIPDHLSEINGTSTSTQDDLRFETEELTTPVPEKDYIEILTDAIQMVADKKSEKDVSGEDIKKGIEKASKKMVEKISLLVKNKIKEKKMLMSNENSKIISDNLLNVLKNNASAILEIVHACPQSLDINILIDVLGNTAETFFETAKTSFENINSQPIDPKINTKIIVAVLSNICENGLRLISFLTGHDDNLINCMKDIHIETLREVASKVIKGNRILETRTNLEKYSSLIKEGNDNV